MSPALPGLKGIDASVVGALPDTYVYTASITFRWSVVADDRMPLTGTATILR